MSKPIKLLEKLRSRKQYAEKLTKAYKSVPDREFHIDREAPAFYSNRRRRVKETNPAGDDNNGNDKYLCF